jgi:hypothetical protein
MPATSASTGTTRTLPIVPRITRPASPDDQPGENQDHAVGEAEEIVDDAGDPDDDQRPAQDRAHLVSIAAPATPIASAPNGG